MLRTISRLWIVMILILGGLTGCGESTQQTTTTEPTAQPAASPAPVETTPATTAPPSATTPPSVETAAPAAEADSVLSQVFAMVPANAAYVHVTDWSLIKRYQGVEELTSKSPLDDREAFLLSTNQKQAAASFYAGNRALQHAEAWGWDSTDLLWEASVESPDLSPTFILKFRPDVDLSTIEPHFQERGFTASSSNGTTIYSHPLDVTADWITLSEFAILNTALIADEQMLVLSSDAGSLQTLLDARANPAETWATDSELTSLATSLGEVAAVTLGRGPDACAGLTLDVFAEQSGGRLTPQQIEQLRERPGRRPGASLYCTGRRLPL